jgi:hypothetical protein
MRKIGIAITVLVSVLSTTSSLPSRSDGPKPMALLGHVRLSAIYSVKARPPYAYALEAGLLNVLDVSDPEHVRVVSEVAFNLARQRIAIYRNWLFLYGFAHPLGLLDISRPDKPRWVAEFPELGGILSSGMEIDGETLYAMTIPDWQSLWTGASASLQIVDVHDPSRPACLGKIDLDVVLRQAEGVNVAVAGNRVYLIVRNAPQDRSRSELIRVNVVDRSRPFIERRDLLPQGKNFKAIHVVGDTMYLLKMAPQLGLALFKLHEDATPTPMGEITDPSISWGIELIVHEKYVYATFKGSANVFTFDVSNQAQPRIVNKYSIDGFGAAGLGMDIVGGRLYVAGDFAPMPIFDVSSGLPRLLGHWNFRGGWADKLEVNGSDLYVGNWGGGLVAFDVHKPSTPQLRWRYEPVDNSEFQHITLPRVWGKYILLGFDSRPADLLDVSGPEPKPVASYQPIGTTSALIVGGEYAYFGTSDSPAEPEVKEEPSDGSIEVVRREGTKLNLITRVKVRAGVTDLAMAAGRLITLTNAGDVLVFDARDPASLHEVARLRLREAGYASRLAVKGNHAFILAQTERGADLSIMDLASEGIRVVHQSHFQDRGYSAALAASDKYLFLYAGQLKVFDISIPAMPVLLTEQRLESLGEPPALVVHGRHLYVSDSESGVWIYALPSSPP